MRRAALTTLARSAPLLALLLASGTSAIAQAGGGSGDLARRTFMNAEQLMREGKVDQALKDYMQVISSFADTSYADDALLRVGSHHYPPETIGELRTVAPASQDAARPYFVQIRERYPNSDSAPHAMFKLGMLYLEPDSPKRNLDEAYASFYGVVNIYPDSDWVGKALLGAAVAEMGKSSYDRAILSLERSLDEAPHGSSAVEAQYWLGVANARLGDFVRASQAFQACRLEDEKGPAGQQALDWLTLIYEMRLRPAWGGAPELEHDAGFVPRLAAGEDFRGELSLAVSSQGHLLVADPRKASLLDVSRDGQKGASDPVPGIRGVSVGATGATIVYSPQVIRIGGTEFPAARREGASVRKLEEVGGVWSSSKKDVFVLDLHEGEVLRYGADPADPKVVFRDKDSGTRVEAIRGGPEDRLYMLDRRQRSILVLQDATTKPLAPPGTAPLFDDPVDLAVDSLGDVYVLDARQRAVIVVAPDGRKLSKISPPAGSVAELQSPRSIAVGARGEVYVYDDRKKTILRFQ
jgi:TolA-binding protein